MIHAPPDSIGRANPSGYMTTDDFIAYLRHFIRFTMASPANPVLLLMDNHSSHVSSVEVIDLCVENGITVVTFPPHCTHKMQPLDVGVFGPVKTTYAVKQHEWQQSNAGKLFEIHHVAETVDKALIVSCTAQHIRTAFETTGIFPVNVNIFTEDHFLASNLSEQSLREEEQPADPDDHRNILIVRDLDEDVGGNEEVATSTSSLAHPSTSSAARATAATFDGQITSTSAAASGEPSTSANVSLRSTLVDIGPIRFAAPRPTLNRGRKPMRSMVLTSPAKRAELQERADNKRRKSEGKSPAKSTAKTPKKSPAKASSPAKTPAKKRTKRRQLSWSSSEPSPPLCSLCGDIWPEGMNRHNTIKCNTCKEPYHLACVDMGNRSYFTCVNCDSEYELSQEEEEVEEE